MIKLYSLDPYLTSFISDIKRRYDKRVEAKKRICGEGSLVDFSNSYLYYGLHKNKNGSWVFREWAPNATAIFLIGEFSDWKEQEQFKLKRINGGGNWEITLPAPLLKHGTLYRLKIHWNGGSGDRIPTHARYVVQDISNGFFNCKVWEPAVRFSFKHDSPKLKQAPFIYETHIGISQEHGKIATYKEFSQNVIPRVAEAGYNVLQIMAIAEHPFYGSFGYQVSNFFAPSSRFGTPDELKELIDHAHSKGLVVIMDIVHSHAVKNQVEGLAYFDGTDHQFFHAGGKGEHSAWDTRCFDYGKDEVLHFLLSNCKYWVSEFKFDGFRFDGVTSMIYHHHGLGKAFTSYDDYFGFDVDEDALTYLSLANEMLKEISPQIITIAEDMSGMPGMASPVEQGGVGFDYRLAMGVPDFWVRMLSKHMEDQWRVGWIWHEVTNCREEEKVISYVESHDQALVGDKTTIFHLIDKDMYTNMSVFNRNLAVDRGIAIHKLIKMVTMVASRGGFLNFMGNEFGHPEWIDFPREGNGYSHHYARRQWSLRDRDDLLYRYLAKFDCDLVNLCYKFEVVSVREINLHICHDDDRVLAFARGKLLFIFNFHSERSYEGYRVPAVPGKYTHLMDSDMPEYAGQSRLARNQEYFTTDGHLNLYLPTRTAIVIEKVD